MSRNTAKWWKLGGDLEEKVCYLMKKEGFHPFKSIFWKVSVLWAWGTLLFVKNTHFCWPTKKCIGLQKIPAYRKYQPTENTSLQKMSAYRKYQPTGISAYRKCQPTEIVSLQKMPAYKRMHLPTDNASLQKCVSLQKNASAYRNVPAYKKKHRPTEIPCKKINELYRLVSTLNAIHGIPFNLY